jgi:hypothetical protein
VFDHEAAEQRERLWAAAETSGVTAPMLGGKVTETDGKDRGKYTETSSNQTILNTLNTHFNLFRGAIVCLGAFISHPTFSHAINTF